MIPFCKFGFCFRLAALSLAAIISLAPGCSTNPATGESSFTGLMSPADEARVGAEENPKVVREFGGVYPDRKVTDYVQRIGQKLAAHTEAPALHYTFTVLDSMVVNAFALPGGYVYVTRGLLALVNSEAELAAVLGHELGHVNAHHAAQRYSQSVLAELGAGMLGVLFQDQQITELAQTGAQLYLASYSRDQERQADELGIRYLRRADYDTMAMARFLTSLESYEKLQSLLTGRPPSQLSFFATHPSTPERIERARLFADRVSATEPRTRVGEADYLTRIDGLSYGDDPDNGVLRGRVFAHKRLRFQFEVPRDFSLLNGEKRVVMRHPSGSLVIFDTSPRAYSGDLRGYIRSVWAPDLTLNAVEPIEVNGLEGATAAGRIETDQSTRDLRLIAIRQSADRIFRFIILTLPAETDALSLELRRMTYSFRLLTPQEAAALRPLRLHVRQVKRGETQSSIAASLPFSDHRLERLETLNGLQPNQPLQPGRLIKIIGE